MVRPARPGNPIHFRGTEVFQAALTYPHIDPIWFTIPLPFTDFGIPIRWYSLAYIGGIVVAWWYLLKLLKQPGAPMARRHADDLVTWVTIGIIAGGRLAYVLFYDFHRFFGPEGSLLDILRLWEGGMSFHGGAIGVSVALFLYTWKHKLSWLRVHDYIACTIPFGLFFGRIANFINGELWGRPSDLPWAMAFPTGGPVTRHPSQLYEAGLEGIVLFGILWFLFWRTDARAKPGFLVGAFLLCYGVFRFLVEFVRTPDPQLGVLDWGLTMGQTLCVPMILGGAYFLATAKGRRTRVEPISGPAPQQ
jgi:phosphatidylglycerol:prolipoprotein diacylglycerol transferase